jgi:glycosyltransferase involved in cell wall biosynthesis
LIEDNRDVTKGNDLGGGCRGKDAMGFARQSSTRKNILLLAHNWDYLPLRPYSVGLHLSARGYNVSLLLPAEKRLSSRKTKHINSRFTLYFCPTVLWGGLKKGSDPLDLITRIGLLRKLRYDIIFAFDSRPTVILPAVYGKSLRRVPLILDWTDWFGRGGSIAERSGKLYRFFFEKLETFFEEHFRKYADSSTVICSALEKRLRALGYSGRIHSFPLGCYPPQALNGDRDSLRRDLGLPVGIRLIGCVGSLLPSDAELLFQSFKMVNERMDTRLLLIGENHLRNRYPIPDNAIVTGRISSEGLQKYVHCCDLMLMPLRNNIANNGRWPSKLNDYLVMGKAVVSTEISVVTELFKLCEFGILAKDTPGDFALKICDLLTDKEKLSLYGRNSLKLALDHLSWPMLMDGLENFIQETLQAYSEVH